jgi:hypothetical protein
MVCACGHEWNRFDTGASGHMPLPMDYAPVPLVQPVVATFPHSDWYAKRFER